MIRYVDTSAALKLVVEEGESEALATDLTRSASRGDRLVASWLLHTDMHCAAERRSVLDPAGVQAVLDGLALIDIERADLLRAGSSLWGLRSADAIHLATALRVEVDELVTYDEELVRVARRVGLRVASPR